MQTNDYHHGNIKDRIALLCHTSLSNDVARNRLSAESTRHTDKRTTSP